MQNYILERRVRRPHGDRWEFVAELRELTDDAARAIAASFHQASHYRIRNGPANANGPANVWSFTDRDGDMIEVAKLTNSDMTEILNVSIQDRTGLVLGAVFMTPEAVQSMAEAVREAHKAE